MITMSGLVPDDEIPIVFTGLRPGEKLEEELMTAEEAGRSRVVGPSIRAISVAAPPTATMQRVAELEALAAQGDRSGVIRLLEALVPTYTGVLSEAHPHVRPALVPLAPVHAAAFEEDVQARRTSAAIRSTVSSRSSG